MGIPKGLEKKTFWRGGGVNDSGIQRAWGIEHFRISEGKGVGVRMFMPLVVGYGYFLESPIKLPPY